MVRLSDANRVCNPVKPFFTVSGVHLRWERAIVSILPAEFVPRAGICFPAGSRVDESEISREFCERDDVDSIPYARTL